MSREGRESELVLKFDIWDRREDPLRDRYRYLVLGHYGSVQFVYGRDPLGGKLPLHFEKEHPGWMGWDLGYHAAEPMYDDQAPMSDYGECDALPPHLRKGRCYYDGSGLNASQLLGRAYAAGSPRGREHVPENDEFERVVRQELTEYYHEIFYAYYDGPHAPGEYQTFERRQSELVEMAADLQKATRNKLMSEAEFAALTGLQSPAQSEEPGAS